MNILTVTALFFLLAVALMLGAAAACRTVWRDFGRRRGAFAALAALAAACTILAQKTSISFDRLISDAGSYATNDVLHVAATNAAAYAAFDFTDSDLLVYRRERGLTNAADWVECLPRRKYGDQPADWHVPDATNYDYLVAVDYVPPSPVHTNGVFELRGFVVPSAASGTRSAAFATSTIADRREIVPVEYLESTGTQWIDTGIVANGEFDADYTISTPSSFRNFIVGGARSTTQHLNFGQYEPNGTFIMAYLGNYWTALTTIAANTTYTARIHYASGSQTATVNGTAAASRSYSGTESLNLNIHLFKRNFYKASDTILPMTGKMYSFKIWQNGVLVRDFIPVRVGRIGYLFDRVSGEYLPFGNKGTGSFVLGPDIKE